MEKYLLSIHEWEDLIQKQKDLIIPIVLHSQSGSMSPQIRANVDAITVVPCTIAEIAIGDIILIRYNNAAGYLLHRVYRLEEDIIQTIGDNLKYPDRPVTASALLGRAVYIDGPGKHIDCLSDRQKCLGRIIIWTYRLRPFFFFNRRVLKKIKRIVLKLA